MGKTTVENSSDAALFHDSSADCGKLVFVETCNHFCEGLRESVNDACMEAADGCHGIGYCDYVWANYWNAIETKA